MTVRLPQSDRAEGVQERRLTPRQQAFVQEYAKDFNATQAAVRAGYSPATARQQASRLLLTNVHVQRALTEHLQKVERASLATMQAVLERDSEIGCLDYFDVFEPGTLVLRNPEDMPEHVRRCIKKLKRMPDGSIEVDFLDPHPLDRSARAVPWHRSALGQRGQSRDRDGAEPRGRPREGNGGGRLARGDVREAEDRLVSRGNPGAQEAAGRGLTDRSWGVWPSPP